MWGIHQPLLFLFLPPQAKVWLDAPFLPGPLSHLELHLAADGGRLRPLVTPSVCLLQCQKTPGAAAPS